MLFVDGIKTERKKNKMIAFVMWHRPPIGFDDEVYRKHLFEFHQSLADKKPKGFVSSHVFRTSYAHCLPNRGDAYEDWFILKDSSGLDGINEAILERNSRIGHDPLAQHARDEATAIYRFRGGDSEIESARYALWLSKPEDVHHLAFLDALKCALRGCHGSAWTSQLGLSPTAEFCLLVPRPMRFHDDIHTIEPLRSIWPEREAEEALSQDLPPFGIQLA